MNNVIIGTAGHIDHGKTTLIKALTGIETDRLKEEKKRGITIELGFAYFDLPDDRKAGIVDVPGHERFIKNMLAGASGIDVVLLVIAADEGIMPQTQEHLDILTLLGVKKGIVVLTKCDLVEEEWLKLVKEEINGKIKGTFLEKAPVIEVSAIEGKGIHKLKETIVELTKEIEKKNIQAPLRLPIDRVFTLSGFGTIVTGTLIEGSISEKEDVMIYPNEFDAKVRSIQVHGDSVKTAYAGQRVAVNLTGIKKEDINRGDVLAKPRSMKSTMMIDVKLDLLKSCNRSLENWARLRLYHGSREVLCRLVLLDREILNPGESCFAQLRLEDKIVSKYGDKFVIRFYSPLETIGGGMILDPNAIKHKRMDEETIKQLEVKSEGDVLQILENVLIKFNGEFIDAEFISVHVGISKDIIQDILEELINNKIVYRFAKDRYIHRTYIDEKEEALIDLLNKFHNKNPLKPGISKEEIRSKIFNKTKGKVFDEILELYCHKGLIKVFDNIISLKDFIVEFSPKQEKIKDKILDLYLNSGYKTPSRDEIIKEFNLKGNDIDILQALIDMNKLMDINGEIILHREKYESAKKLLKDYLTEHKEIALSQYRDLLNTSRKYVVPLLEHFDSIKLTKRVGDKRVLY